MLHQDLVESDKPESWDLFSSKFISNVVSDRFTLTRKNGAAKRGCDNSCGYDTLDNHQERITTVRTYTNQYLCRHTQ